LSCKCTYSILQQGSHEHTAQFLSRANDGVLRLWADLVYDLDPTSSFRIGHSLFSRSSTSYLCSTQQSCQTATFFLDILLERFEHFGVLHMLPRGADVVFPDGIDKSKIEMGARLQRLFRGEDQPAVCMCLTACGGANSLPHALVATYRFVVPSALVSVLLAEHTIAILWSIM
jgi:hypothetical protein